jgi:hypothetical protein
VSFVYLNGVPKFINAGMVIMLENLEGDFGMKHQRRGIGRFDRFCHLDMTPVGEEDI